MKTVVLCSSAMFYKHVNDLAEELEKLGFKCIIPLSARQMKQAGNYDVTSVKTWYKNPKDFHKKAHYITEHMKEIEKGDVILVVNDKKHGIEGYVGPNVVMEMGVAFYLNKPIYVLNAIDNKMPTFEEVYGLNSIIINGDLSKISV